jgi:hypothetical protein
LATFIHVHDISVKDGLGGPGIWVNTDAIDFLESTNKGQDTEIPCGAVASLGSLGRSTLGSGISSSPPVRRDSNCWGPPEVPGCCRCRLGAPARRSDRDAAAPRATLPRMPADAPPHAPGEPRRRPRSQQRWQPSSSRDSAHGGLSPGRCYAQFDPHADPTGVRNCAVWRALVRTSRIRGGSAE